MSRGRAQRMAKRFDVPMAHIAFMRRRVSFLLEPLNDGPRRTLIDLLANAYQQGVEDTVAFIDRCKEKTDD